MLSKNLQGLEKIKAEFLNKISALDEDALRWSPSEKKWSIDQVIHHLILAEQASLSYMNKKILAVDSMRVEKFKSRRNLLSLQIFFASPFKWKAPQINIVPKLELSHSELLQEWDQVRNDLKDFISSNSEKNLEKNIFRHPLAGRMNMKDTLRFTKLHIQHHMKQVNRIAKAGKFSDQLN